MGEAHPRAGGENRQSDEVRRARGGSSPRGRGKLDGFSAVVVSFGLIPARAGKTRGVGFRRRFGPAHPRAGGENAMTPPARSRRAGSSPRGRGKRHHTHEVSQRGRLIPARAGKTPPRHGMRPPPPAHPRAGGENTLTTWPANGHPGSSPRGRGKPAIRLRPRNSRRLIPARAGKTRRTAPSPRGTSAHPRAGGENPGWLGPEVRPHGSSPRGRGKPTLPQ